MGAPDEFHPDAHPKAKEITGDRRYGEWGQCVASRNKVDERCKGYAKGPHGKCHQHGGSSTGPKTEEGKEEVSENAVTHGAFREHFTSHLTDAEEEAFEDAFEQLETPEGAQDVARSAAANCLLQFQRSGDERFLRRFEGLCDKFGIAPADELDVNHSGIEEMFMDDLREYHDE